MASAKQALEDRLRRVNALNRAASLLHWDQQTMMPSGGTEARAQELATLHAVAHEIATDPEVGKLIQAVDAEAATQEERALVREARWSYERAVRVPDELVEQIAGTTARAHEAWVKAKAESDYASFEPWLAKVLELKRAYAEAIDPDRDPYEVLYEDYEPWLPLPTAEATIQALGDGLAPLIQRAPEPPEPGEGPLAGAWPIEGQATLSQALLERMGYDFQRGRLDQAPHPFSSGNRYDARVTTRYEPEDPISAVTSTIHEMGHAMYTQGLPEAHFGTPVGQSRNLVVHESQSRFWENHVARSRPFWDMAAPMMEQAFPDKAGRLEPEACWRAANVVQPTLIRVDSDELTYHLHIALRTELEAQLVRGELSTSELPAAWNERTEALLGLKVPDDARGVLQDVHWSGGSFGYFPTYSLGSMLAAQLSAALEDALGPLDALIADEAFGELEAWMGDNVHAHGRLYTTPALIEQATGAPLGHEAFLAYAERKYDRLWA